MVTVIKCRGKLEVCETERPIPLKEDGTVDYNMYLSRIIMWWKTNRTKGKV